MEKNTITLEKSHHSNTFNNALEETLREGARRLLQQAIEAEVEDYIEAFKHVRDNDDKRLVIRNGHLPKRSIQTGMGPIEVKQARVRDKRIDCKFTTKILPKYVRKAPSIETVIPALYLKGISTSDFSEALKAILGDNATGFSFYHLPS